LTDQHGNTVSKADLLGKPWVVCFIFTRCAGRCPAIIQSVNRLDKQLEDVDVRFVAISVDPKTDTPAVLKRYADVYQANSGRWLYLTGDQAAIHELIRRSFLMPVVENFGSDRLPGFEFAHSLQVLHVDAEGKVAGRYDPQNETDMVKLRRALQGSATGERG
jgi:cytochrome oxidase Cu insertion factor (SCO1/SenC/PrrC family)